jgi:hypothetical protein
MKNLMLLLSFTLLIGCIKFESDKAQNVHSPDKLIYSAWSYIGMSERYDRHHLYELLTVDPVTTQWCAAFVNTVLTENNIPTSEHNLLARSFLTWGDPVARRHTKR